MDLSVLSSSVLKKRSALALGGLLALTACAGSMQASTYLSALAASASALTAPLVTCATLTGPPASGQTFTVHATGAPTGFSIVVGVTQTPGVKVTPPAAVILNAATNVAGLVFTVNSTAGCSNANGITANSLVAGANTIPVVLTAALNGASAVSDNSVTVTDTIATGAGTSALVAANVTITCGYNSTGPVFVPGEPQTVSVSSAANLGTPFSVTTSGLPAWLVLGPVAPAGTAGTTAVNFTVQAASGTTPANGCGGGIFTTNQTFSLPLTSSPAPAVNVTITLKIVSSLSPLTAVGVPASPTFSMSYTKSSGVPATQTINLTSSIATLSASTYYSVVNFPTWLTVNFATGFIPVTTGKNLIFSTTSAVDSLPPGTYTSTVYVQVANYADAPITITLLVANKAPTLSVTSANPMPVLYTLGGSTPVSTISIVSTDSPIPYTVSFGGLLAPALATGLNQQLTGIAYSFGTNIYITYNPVLFESSAPGTVLSGTVTFTWGPPATSSTPATVTVVTINLTVGSPAATLTSISPASLPTAAPGSVFTVTLTGSGFVGGTDPALATKVGYVTGSAPATVNQDPNMRATWVNPSNMTLQITVPALVSGGNGDSILPFLVGGSGGSVYLGVVNGSSTTPTGTATLTIGANPIIYGVSSSSSFTEVSGGALPSFAPYDMISIFGSNFCSSAVTFPAPVGANGGCTSTTILPGKPDPVYGVFPFSLTPDQYITPTPPASSLFRNLTVTLYPHGTSSGGLNAPLLFATNGQINAIVPGAATAGDEYDIWVGFGPSTAIANSAPYPVNIVATDPGIFTIGSDGQGAAAALNLSYSLINSANPAAMRSGAGNSDIIQLYVTGLGLPANGTAIYTSGNGACISALNGGQAGYLTALDAQTSPLGSFTAIDGAVLNYSLFTGDLPPCLTALPTVTIGGQATPTPTFAGFVDGTVAGLYQINVKLPRTDPVSGDLQPNFPNSTTGEVATLLTPTQLPVYVTLNSVTSQAGVYVNVAPKLKMVATSFPNATVGQAYTGQTITASLGTANYSFAVTLGVIPNGITWTAVASTGVLTFAGTPAENTSGTYNFTITATDSAAAPLTGSIPITITVLGGLYVTETGTSPFSGSVYGSAGSSLPVVTAIGGTGPYSYVPAVETVASFGGGSLAAPTGMSAPGTVTGAFATTGVVVAGTYQVVVTATDSLGVTGTINFVDTIGLLMAAPSTTDNTTLVAASGGTVATEQVTGFTGTAMGCVIVPLTSGLSCTVAAGGLATITASAGGLTASSPVTFAITVTDNATAPAAEAGTFGVGTSVAITVDPI